jgi:hypothetical protein
MTDQASGSTPAGSAPASNNAAPPRPSMPAQSSAQPEHNADRTRGHSPAMQSREQQQNAPAEQKIKVGDAEYTQQELSDALARDAETRIRRSELPATAEAYEAKNSPEFKLPEGIKAFEFNKAAPELAAVRKFALDNGLTQSQFSGLLDIYVVCCQPGQRANATDARPRGELGEPWRRRPAAHWRHCDVAKGNRRPRWRTGRRLHIKMALGAHRAFSRNGHKKIFKSRWRPFQSATSRNADARCRQNRWLREHELYSASQFSDAKSHGNRTRLRPRADKADRAIGDNG